MRYIAVSAKGVGVDSRRPVRSTLVRGIVLLTVAFVAAGALSPAFGAKKGLTKKKVKAIATKVFNKQLPVKGNPIFIEEDELVRYGPIGLQVGAADQTIASFGPLTLIAHCEDDGGLVLGELRLDTSEDNSTYYAGTFDEPGSALGDFDAADPPAVIHEGPGAAPGGATTVAPPGITTAMAPSGTWIVVTSQQAQNFGGSHCMFAGSVLVVAPR
jgi:hypothetical protein